MFMPHSGQCFTFLGNASGEPLFISVEPMFPLHAGHFVVNLIASIKAKPKKNKENDRNGGSLFWFK